MNDRQSIHSRYERNSEGVLCLDVAADKAEDLYNNFDRHSPYIRRDLDQDLADYLAESAAELLPHPFLIRFMFNQQHDYETLTRVRNSVATFFQYMAGQEHQRLRRMARRSGIFLLAGISMLVGSVLLYRSLGTEPSVAANVFAEGVNIATWVSLWEALAVFLVDWYPHARQLRVYKSLSEAPVEFIALAGPAGLTAQGSRD